MIRRIDFCEKIIYNIQKLAIANRRKNMTQYNVSGMSCAACSARVEKAVNSVEGVSSCAVSLLTNSMGVEGTASPEEIIKAVTAAGYGAELKSEEKSAAERADDLRDTETPKILLRLILSVVFLLPLMYVSMGHMMWGWSVPAFLSGNHTALGIVQMLLSAIIIAINNKFFISGFKGVLHGAPNMDTLVALGSGASFVYSVIVLFTAGGEHLYFESAAMILTLITVGKLLESYSKGRTTDALKGLMSLAPQTATVIIDGSEREVPIETVKVDDIFVVRAGESIPVDGVIIEGESAINEAALTGESIPCEKTAGDAVSAATVNTNGFIKCRATRVGEDTTLSQIIKMVSDAAATKAPIAKVADRVSGVFVPVVIAVAIITLLVWLLVGKAFSYALSRGISVLVISCPCALGLATPVAVMVGSGKGAKNGILFKTAASLEETGRAQIIALDKTGTITKGEPEVTNIIPADGVEESALIGAAYSLEAKSEHPLAKAVCTYAEENGFELAEASSFRVLSGNGVIAESGGAELYGGNAKFVSSKVNIPADLGEKAAALAEQGKTPLFFASDKSILGIIAVADVIKDDSISAVNELKNMGLKVVMLTGDNNKTANAIGSKVGVDAVISDVLPDGKESIIRQLQTFGKVVMVGDGINDAPALTRADIGIAIGAGADVAVDSADVVLMNSRLTDVAAAIRLSRGTLTNIYENLFWAFIYNIIGIPLAAGVWIPLTGWTLSPMFGAAAMSLSSFCVVTNALRLNFFKLFSTKHDKKKNTVSLDLSEFNNNQKEQNTMTKTVRIDGMMCPHCEAAVKKAFEELPQVTSAEVSHEQGTAILTLSADLSDDEIKATVEAKDYTFISVE